jgi:hypothetical protein
MANSLGSFDQVRPWLKGWEMPVNENFGSSIRNFQAESDEDNSHRRWKEIEKTVFGVDYPDC